MPDCSPVSQWPPVSGLVPWEMLRRRWRKVDRDVRGKGFEEPRRKCTRITSMYNSMSQNSPSYSQFYCLSYFLDRCRTVCREQGLWKAQYLTHARREDLKWFSHPSALFAEVMLPEPCDQLSSLRIHQAFSNLPNLEHIGFFSFKSVFLLQRFLSLCRLCNSKGDGTKA